MEARMLPILIVYVIKGIMVMNVNISSIYVNQVHVLLDNVNQYRMIITVIIVTQAILEKIVIASQAYVKMEVPVIVAMSRVVILVIVLQAGQEQIVALV